MRLFLYYGLHSFVNQLRKLLKTWVLIFLLACMVIGGLIGLGVATLEDAAEQNAAAEAEVLPEEEIELPPEIEELTEPRDVMGLVELIAGAVILGVLLYEVLSADRNGSKIFLPADVNLLFSSPMRPQSVLLFRLGTQLGTAILATLYLLIQLPNLVLNIGMSLWGGLAVIAAWCFTIVLGKLLQVLVYLLCSNHPALKQNLHRVIYVLLAVLAGGWFLFWKKSALSPFAAAKGFFNAPGTRYIPIWGWLKGFCLSAAEGNTAATLVFLALIVLGAVVLWWIVSRTKADFYEDAMAKSEETAELLQRAQSEKSSGIVLAKRKKDRSEKLRRDAMTHGRGANVFFYKSIYNRFRFAHLGFLTKTTETYLAAGIGAAALCRFVFGAESLLPVVLALAGLAFFRALGNPLAQDTKMDFFRLIPESPWAKLFYSLLGGGANCLLDLLPGLICGTLLVRGNLLQAFAWIPFILSIDLYATCVGTFIDLSVPVSAGKTVKQIIQVMFVYFGLLPDIAILAIGIVVTGHTAAAALLAAVVNLVLGGLFFALCPLYLEPGSGKAVPAASGSAADIPAARRVFSRIGFAGAAILIVGSALQIAVSAGLTSSSASWVNQGWVMWLATFLPLYLIAFPLGWLMVRKLPTHRIGGERWSFGRFLLLIPMAVCLMYAGNLLGVGINLALEALIHSSDGNPIAAFAMDDSLPLKILFMVILAPLLEELFFRKLIIDRTRIYGERLAIAASAVMFGLFHGNLSQFFYAALLGALFGYVYIRTERLRYSVGLHMLINCLGSVVAPALVQPAAIGGIAGLEDMSAALTPGALAASIYGVVMILLALLGLVLLIVRRRFAYLLPAPAELPKGRRFAAAWLNPGMILFTLVCLVIFALTLI